MGSMVGVLCAGLVAVAAVLSSVAADEDVPDPPHVSVRFPGDWIVEAAPVQGETDEGGALLPAIVTHAYPEHGGEECSVVDLTSIGGALASLGVADPSTMDRVAVDILGHGSGGTTSTSGPGYDEAWSSRFEGTESDGATFALYSYRGLDAWAGLEDVWMAVHCRSDDAFHEDWDVIAGTFEFRPPAWVAASTGPVAYGSRLESSSSAHALEVPDGWIGVDLTDPALDVELRSLDRAAEWFAEALAGPFGDSLAERAAAGDVAVLMAWLPTDGPYWLESCELATAPSRWASIDELLEFATGRVAADPQSPDEHGWTKVRLPAGEAARHDFRWSASAAGSAYILLAGDRQETLTCQDTGLGPGELEVRRARWLEVAESLEIPGAGSEQVVMAVPSVRLVPPRPTVR